MLTVCVQWRIQGGAEGAAVPPYGLVMWTYWQEKVDLLAGKTDLISFNNERKWGSDKSSKKSFALATLAVNRTLCIVNFFSLVASEK